MRWQNGWYGASRNIEKYSTLSLMYMFQPIATDNLYCCYSGRMRTQFCILCYDWLTGDHCDQLFVVQSGLPQQGQLFHDAADRGTVFDGSPCWRHYAPVLDYQTTAKGASTLSVSVPCNIKYTVSRKNVLLYFGLQLPRFFVDFFLHFYATGDRNEYSSGGLQNLQLHSTVSPQYLVKLKQHKNSTF